ncbi:MAG: hypothetical protein WAM42_10805 [Candidatus Nitrosopolaris sp.]
MDKIKKKRKTTPASTPRMMRAYLMSFLSANPITTPHRALPPNGRTPPVNAVLAASIIFYPFASHPTQTLTNTQLFCPSTLLV